MSLIRLLGVGCLVATGCSIIVDSDAVQCRSNQDCALFDAGGATLTCVSNVCVGPANEPPCTQSSDCIARNNGAPAVCRKDNSQCEPLLSTECIKVYGDPSNDDAIVIGTLFTLSGVNQPSGQARTQSAELAVDDFTNTVVGLPGSADGKPRPLVLVECDDGADNTQATNAANHLIQVGVAGIIGPGGSGLVTAVVQNATIPAKLYVITPSATATTLSGLSPYLWRTAPSDTVQAIAMQDQEAALQTAFKAANPLVTKLKLGIAYQNNTYGTGLYGALTNGLTLNGVAVTDSSNSGFFLPLSYDATTLDPSPAASSVLSAASNLITGIGTTEIVTGFLTPIEAGWLSTNPRPLYLFSDAGEVPALLTAISASTTGLRTRVRGTVPGTNNPLFQTFSVQYLGKYGSQPDVFGMAGAYDSVYIIAYGITSLGTGAITGDALSGAMAKIVGGTASNVGAGNIKAALQVLESGNAIQINGASGPLHFDLNLHEAKSDITVWCVNLNGSNAPAFAPSGRYYDSPSGTMMGTYNCP